LIRPTTGLLAHVGATLVLTLALAACASASGTAGTATSAPTAAPPAASAAPSTAGGGSTGTTVSIKDFSFDPAGLTAKVGQEITWTNTGSATHTVTFDAGGVDSGSLSAGSTFKHTFDTAGTFTYHCSFHSAMQSTVTVSQ
jgi:plastocyanin